MADDNQRQGSLEANPEPRRDRIPGANKSEPLCVTSVRDRQKTWGKGREPPGGRRMADKTKENRAVGPSLTSRLQMPEDSFVPTVLQDL